MPNPNPHLALADAAEQRANAATKPPWIRDEYDRPNMQVIAHGNEVVCYHRRHNRQIDARVVPNYDFIAHARQDVPALAAAVRDLDKVNTEQAATIAALQAKLSEALALAFEAYGEGYEAGDDNFMGEPVENFWDKSETRAAVERLKGTV